MKSRFEAWRGLVPALLLPALLLAASLQSSPAAAQTQDLRPVYDRIERLQRDIDVLQRQLARGGSAPAASGVGGGSAPVSSDFIGRTEDRFSAVEQELRVITGKLEELSHQIGQTQQRLDKLVGDVDFRLTALEKGGAASAPATTGAAPSPAAPPANAGVGPAQVAPGQTRLVLQPGAGANSQQAAAPAAGAVQLPQGSPEAQYEFAYGTLLQAQREQADLGRAEQALRAFISANPNHRLTGNAQYWLGETFYARRDWQNAAATFAEGVQKFGRSDKAPDNMLKLGMSLGQLNRKPEACGTLGELEKRYPQAPAQVKQAATRERQRLGCG